MVGGGTPSKKNPAFWVSGAIPWVSPKDMSTREVFDAQDHISQAAVDGSATQIVPTGSVLVVVRSGILVRRFPIAIARRPVALNQDMKALLPGGPLSPEFLAYALEARCKQVLSGCVKRGATVHSIDIGKLNGVQLPVPPPSEQRRIVEILDQADQMRRKRAEVDAKAEGILPAVFYDIFGDPAMNPKRWRVTTLGELTAEFRYGTSTKCEPDETGMPVLRIPNILGGEVNLSDLKYAELSDDEVERLRLTRGDLLFVRTNGNRDYVGRCAVFDLEEPHLFASYLIRARLNPSEADPWYVAAFMRTLRGRHAMAPFIRTTAGQSNISIEGLAQIPLPCPPLAHQAKFRTRIESLRALARQRNQAGDVLNEAFASLLHGAISGDLTAKWREAHKDQLEAEMEEQAGSVYQGDARVDASKKPRAVARTWRRGRRRAARDRRR